VDYRHVIHALSAKPQAFRYSQIRDELLPNDRYRRLWQHVDEHLPARQACKWIVGVLRLACDYECEGELIDSLESLIAQNSLPDLKALQASFLPQDKVPDVAIDQHALSDYDNLLTASDVAHQGHGEAAHV
jgi:hypothetical protein